MKNNNKILDIISKIENKDFNIYFIVMDSKGNPNAGVAYIYKQAKYLEEAGYNVTMLTESSDHIDAGSWIDKRFTGLNHQVTNKLTVKPEDILVIPEIYGSIMENSKNLPCKRIIIAQNYEFMMEVLDIGKSWVTDFKISDVIVTNDNMVDHVLNLFHIDAHKIPVSIDNIYKSENKPYRVPTVLLGGRDSSLVMRFVKSFFLANPQYSWVKFKQISGMKPDELLLELQDSMCLVWIDPKGSFGTLPLEAMKCKTPVVGVIPDMIPEWMKEENGFWVRSVLDLPSMVANVIGLSLEDEVFENINEDVVLDTPEKYSIENQQSKTIEVYEGILANRINELKTYITNEE